ncbi:MAG: response regulator transcription factor, partial [Bacteroidota bacterium]
MKQEKKVLIIEDDQALQETISNLLSLEGFTVYQAKEGDSGITMAKNHLPDVIVCDIMMPGFTGLDVLKKLQTDEKTSTIPFIFLTAKAELKDVRNGMLLGADDYLTKPFDNEDLLQSINLRLNKKDRII